MTATAPKVCRVEMDSCICCGSAADDVVPRFSGRCFETLFRNRYSYLVARPKQRTDNLSGQLLESALALLEAGDASLTARSVAAAANTSTAALYELFGDKAGLLRSLFFEGFRRLHDQMAALDVTDDPRKDLVSVLAATRAFGLQQPMLFELMFARPFAEFRPSTEDHSAAKGIYRIVMSRVDRALEEGEVSGNRVDIAQVLVATNRGLITAELAGLLASSPNAAQRRWHLAISALIDGLRP
jgi:AcrR family transcriptional regulator